MAKPKRGDLLELVVDDLAFRGDGAAPPAASVLFLPRGLPAFEVGASGPAPAAYGYRNKVEFQGGGPQVHIGLHEAERYDVVLDIERCLLQSDTMNALLDELRAQARARGLSVWEPRSER